MKRGRQPGLRRAFPIVAAALGRRFGVNVVIQGADAMTDGKTIIVPALPPDSDMKEVAWGYLAHEAAHVRYTDFDVIKKSSSSAIRRATANVLEDIRIEKALAAEYPGTRRTIGKVVEYLIGKEQMTAPAETAHPGALLQAYLLLRLRADVLGQAALCGQADKAEETLRQTFPKGVVTRLNGLLANVPPLSTSRDALRLADDILRMLKEEEERQIQEQACASAGDVVGKSAQAISAAPTGQSTLRGQLADGNEKRGDEGTDTVSAINGEDRAKLDALKQLQSASDSDVAKDLFELVGEILSAQSVSDELLMPAVVRVPDRKSARRQLLNETIAESLRIRTKLTGLVQAHRIERPWDKVRGRKVNSGRLHRLVIGDARVFVHRTRRTAPNTAIHLLVDTSASMSEEVRRKDGTRTTRCDIALRSALALALALETIPGVSLAVTCFPANLAGAAIVLQHGERVRANAGRFAQVATGGTPMAPAMWYAASVLLSRREPRKVMMVLTDGMPDNEQSTRDIAMRCGAAGIEVIGIGIELPAVTALFSSSVVINETGELRKALFDLVQRTLIAA